MLELNQLTKFTYITVCLGVCTKQNTSSGISQTKTPITCQWSTGTGSDPADSDMYLVVNSELQHILGEKAEETKVWFKKKVGEDLCLDIWVMERKAGYFHYIGHHSPIRQNQLNEIPGQNLSPYRREWGHAKLKKLWKLVKPISHYLIICVSLGFLMSSGVLLYFRDYWSQRFIAICPFTAYWCWIFRLMPPE